MEIFMNCEFCGKPVEDNESRCRYCGSVLVNQKTENQKTIEQTQYIKGSDVRRSARRRASEISESSESTSDNTGVYPRTDDGFENSKRIRDEVNSRHNAAPTKRQYYRYNPNEMPRKNNVRRRRSSKSDYPKPAHRKLKIGRTIGRLILLAVLGFVIGIAVYAVTINVTGWINDKKSDVLESLPSATAAADNYGNDENKAEKSESTPKPGSTSGTDRSESGSSDNRSDNDNTGNKNNTHQESKTESNSEKTQTSDEYDENEDKTTSAEADSSSDNNNNSADKNSDRSSETNAESGVSDELED